MYHYAVSGLDNVWLENGYTFHKTAYGKGVSFADPDGLDKVLALHLVEKPARLTGQELRYLRTLLDLSQAAFGKMVDVTDQAVSLWERNGKVPMVADRWIRLLTLGKVDGRTSIADFLARLPTEERLVNQRIVATQAANKRWRLAVQEEPADA